MKTLRKPRCPKYNDPNLPVLMNKIHGRARSRLGRNNSFNSYITITNSKFGSNNNIYITYILSQLRRFFSKFINFLLILQLHFFINIQRSLQFCLILLKFAYTFMINHYISINLIFK